MFLHVVIYFLAFIGALSLVLLGFLLYALNEIGKIVLPVTQGIVTSVSRRYV